MLKLFFHVETLQKGIQCFGEICRKIIKGESEEFDSKNTQLI